LDNDLVADQRLATPFHGDEGEQSMLDPVPHAGAGWQMVAQRRSDATAIDTK
jgi:hypothetical protein